jgi:hypothetical protein
MKYRGEYQQVQKCMKYRGEYQQVQKWALKERSTRPSAASLGFKSPII